MGVYVKHYDDECRACYAARNGAASMAQYARPICNCKFLDVVAAAERLHYRLTSSCQQLAACLRDCRRRRRRARDSPRLHVSI